MKPNCYECKWRADIGHWDCHSKCIHLDIGGEIMGLAMAAGVIKWPPKMNVSGNKHGIKNGWFNFPANFDPVWLETCNGFERKEVEKSNEYAVK